MNNSANLKKPYQSSDQKFLAELSLPNILPSRVAGKAFCYGFFSFLPSFFTPPQCRIIYSKVSSEEKSKSNFNSLSEVKITENEFRTSKKGVILKGGRVARILPSKATNEFRGFKKSKESGRDCCLDRWFY